jgi:hypothetical protein
MKRTVTFTRTTVETCEVELDLDIPSWLAPSDHTFRALVEEKIENGYDPALDDVPRPGFGYWQIDQIKPV